MTILLGHSDLTGLLSIDECLTALRDGFAALPVPVTAQRVRTDLPGPGTATALIPGLLDGIPAYTVKVNAKFPGSDPALRGVVCLHDLNTGALLAVLDSATITAWRTGLAAALGTDRLARHDISEVGVIGAGAQARLVVDGLSRLRGIGGLTVHDLDGAKAAALAGDSGRVAASPAEVAARCDLVVLATWARSPLLGRSEARPGMHLTSLGADEPGKAELDAELLRAAYVVVDDVEFASGAGALGAVGLGPEYAAATLGDILRGAAAARTGAEQITVYAPVGLPWQDLALSWLAYRRALRTGTGTAYDWLR